MVEEEEEEEEEKEEEATCACRTILSTDRAMVRGHTQRAMRTELSTALRVGTTTAVMHACVMMYLVPSVMLPRVLVY